MIVGSVQYVTVVEEDINGLAGLHFIIEGANVHVRSGAGSTQEGCGGIDYDCITRTGLGNVIIGYNEKREDYFSFVSGGVNNTASGFQSSINGGFANEAFELRTVILGGDSKLATTAGCVVGDNGVDC